LYPRINMKLSITKLFLLLLTLIAVFSNAAYAQDDEEEADEAEAADDEDEDDAAYEQPEVASHPLTNMEAASDDVTTTYVLPGHEGSTFNIAVGTQNAIIVGFVNGREADSEGNGFKIRAIMGSLNSVYDFNQYFQNFTAIEFQPQEVVDPGAEMTFEFNFNVDSSVDLQSSQLALTIFYEDENEDFASTFFNETVQLFEASGQNFKETLGTYFFLIVIVGAIGYFGWEFVKGQMGIKASKPAAAAKVALSTEEFMKYDDDLMDVYASNDTMFKGKKKKEAEKQRVKANKAKNARIAKAKAKNQ